MKGIALANYASGARDEDALTCFPLPAVSGPQQGGGDGETTIKLMLLLFFGFKRKRHCHGIQPFNPHIPAVLTPPSPSMFQHCQGSRCVLFKLRWATQLYQAVPFAAEREGLPYSTETPLRQPEGRGAHGGTPAGQGALLGALGTTGTWEGDPMEQIRAFHLRLPKYRDAFSWTFSFSLDQPCGSSGAANLWDQPNSFGASSSRGKPVALNA